MKHIMSISIAIFVFISSAVAANNSEIKKDWPSTCEEAAKYVVDGLDELALKDMEEKNYSEIVILQEKWGKGMENYMGLWQGNDALMLSCVKLRKDIEPSPSNISKVILEEAWKIVNVDELAEKAKLEDAELARIDAIKQREKETEIKMIELMDKEKKAEKDKTKDDIPERRDEKELLEISKELKEEEEKNKIDKNTNVDDLFNPYNKSVK